MATYKVIQDIEADDKLVGPFGIRQFIYLLIVAVTAYIGFRAAEIAWFLALPFLPFIIFFGMLALPFGGAQPTEVWLLAKFRFFLKPKKHVWSQDGVRELVTITAPKVLEKHLTKELSQTEVQSRLKALASTIDSRGWSVKNINPNAFSQPAFAAAGAGSDRLVDVGAAQPQASDVNASDDMLDEQNNPTAQNLGRMVSASSKTRREQLVQQMKQGVPPAAPTPDSNQAPAPSPATPPQPRPVAPPSKVVKPEPSAVQQQQQKATGQPQQTRPLTEEELLEKIHAEQEKPKNYGHMRVVKPIEEQEAEAAAQAKQAAQAPPAQQPAQASEPSSTQAGAQTTQPVTPPPDPDIIELASNDDLNVETIARQANKKKKKTPPGEVVIELH